MNVYEQHGNLIKAKREYSHTFIFLELYEKWRNVGVCMNQFYEIELKANAFER